MKQPRRDIYAKFSHASEMFDKACERERRAINLRIKWEKKVRYYQSAINRQNRQALGAGDSRAPFAEAVLHDRRPK